MKKLLSRLRSFLHRSKIQDVCECLDALDIVPAQAERLDARARNEGAV